MKKYILPEEIKILKSATINESCNEVIDGISANLNEIQNPEVAKAYTEKIINQFVDIGILEVDELNQIYAGKKFAESFELHVYENEDSKEAMMTTINYVENLISSVANRIREQEAVNREQSIDISL